MKFINAVLIAAAVLTLGACTNQVTVSSDYDSKINFAEFKTYRWHAPNQYTEKSKQYLGNNLIDQRIRTNVDEQLQSKGYQLQENGEVDFLVNYSISTEPRVDINTYNTYDGFAPGWGYGGYYGGGPYVYSGVGYGAMSTNTSVTHYEQGTLVLDIVKPDSDKLIWRATAEGRLQQDTTQAEKEDIAKEIIGRVLANFPPDS